MKGQNAFRVLLVDDDPQVLKLFSRLLRSGGYSVIAVSSGTEALRQLEADPEVDVVVLDLDMPETDGFDVLKALRRRPKPPILAVSGCMGDALLKPAELLGATAALSKVDAPKQLLTAVSELVRARPHRSSEAG